MDGQGRKAVVAGALLAVVILVVYARVAGHAFVEFDDPIYLTENPHIRQGLSWDGVRWALTTRWSFLWHPVTWLSYLADYEVHGLVRAGPVLVANAVLHALASGLLLVVLVRMTGQLWPCVLASALFALHPMRVESVAWAAARKDVLCLLFFVLTLWAWNAWTTRRSAGRYAAVLALYGACLASKPTLVTLPVLLLLLDVWPLRRLSLPPQPDDDVTPGAALLEKLPLLALAIAATLRSLQVQGDAHNLWVEDPGLSERIGNALVSCVLYLGRTLWPSDLAIAHLTLAQLGGEGWSAAQIAAALAGLLGMTLGAAWLARRGAGWRAVAIGWLWFLVALGPALHLVPWGLRVMHDRYTEIPHVGLFLAVAFGALAWAGEAPLRRRLVAGVGAAVLLALTATTWREIGFYRDSEALFDHTLAAEPRNPIALYGRSVAFARAGRREEAMRDLRAALAVHPRYSDAHSNLGVLLLEEGDVDRAIASFEAALAIHPGSVKALVNLGNAQRARGDAAEARRSFERAVAAAGSSSVGADAWYWLGVMREPSAPGDAASDYLRALALDPHHPWSLLRLGMLFEASGRGGEALAHYRRVPVESPPHPEALAREAWVLVTDPDPRVRDVTRGLALAEQLPEGSDPLNAGYTLGAARAAAGDFAGAVAAISNALAARPDADAAQRAELERCRRLYAAGQPFVPATPAAGP